MARQSQSPVTFGNTVRPETGITMSSGRAGVVVPVTFFPLFPGDSASGRVAIDIELAEMPRPLLNGVSANFQAWVYPKEAHPKFAGTDEVMHAFTGEPIKGLGFADRTPPPFFDVLTGTPKTTAAASDLFVTLGLHIPTGSDINADLVDAFVQIYNFRLAAHSSRLERRKYAVEDIAEACALPPAFWPTGRFSTVVPDYERALVIGSMDLDVAAGLLPIDGFGLRSGSPSVAGETIRESDGSVSTGVTAIAGANIYSAAGFAMRTRGTAPNIFPDLFANMAGQQVVSSLAAIDKARVTQAFAKLRAAYAGNDTTGFDNDDALVAMLMQGLEVPADQYKRPWLLDSKRVPVGFAERFATDAANLDQSVTQGRAAATLSLNVPKLNYGGMVVVTVEVLPEQIHERQSDEFLLTTTVAGLPNALRDVQRTEPVDVVLNRRIDAKHTTPGGTYGYEPMNHRWRREATRLGGAFYQATPGAAWTEQRSAIWQTEIVNPVFDANHYLAPVDFPHDVFSDTLADAFEFVARHQVAVSGLTQMGDILVENSDDYETVQETN